MTGTCVARSRMLEVGQVGYAYVHLCEGQCAGKEMVIG